MSKEIHLNISSDAIMKSVGDVTRKLSRYRAFLLFLAVALLYSFIIWRINALSDPSPTAQDPSTSTVSRKSPHIDQATVDKITKLQDNSVNVQSLFDQARQNPFQESQ